MKTKLLIAFLCVWYNCEWRDKDTFICQGERHLGNKQALETYLKKAVEKNVPVLWGCDDASEILKEYPEKLPPTLVKVPQERLKI